MSFASEYNKLRNERINSGGGNSKSSGNSFADEYNKLRSQRSKKKEEEEIFSVNAIGNGFIAPVKDDEEKWYEKNLIELFKEGKAKDKAKSTDKEEKERKWFQKGAFEDGYDFGDITKTILGSTTDIAENLGSGIIGMGEKAVDALAYLAPYAYQSQYIQASGGFTSPEQQKMVEGVVEQGKKDIAPFIAKDLYNEEKIAKAIISNPVKYVTGIDAEADSVFGEKSDALVQSAGQLAAQVGLQAVGVPWFVTSGVTSFGSEVENAFNQGASYEAAGASAAISAGAEVLSEKLFGGDLFVKSAGTDIAKKYIATGIANKTLQKLVALGFDAGGEAVEEVFSEVMSNIGSSLYKEENIGEILFSEEAIDGYIEAAIGGAALGGIMTGVNAVKSGKEGVDYVTGLNESERKVVDKLYNDLVAEAEKEGKVSPKEKVKLYDSIINRLDKGDISIETIEEILGGDSYTAYNELVSEADEFKTLYETKSGDLSKKDQDRLAELEAKNKANPYETAVQTAKDNLSQSVFGLAENSRLAESYNERTRRGQAFEADLSKYDAKYHGTIQKAIDSGILNNTNRTHEFVDMIAKISADKGVPFDFANNAKLKESGFAIDGKQVNGLVTKDGITLNIDSAKALNTTVGHEITHVLEGTELYGDFQELLFEYAKSKGEYDSRLDEVRALYSGVDGYTGADAETKFLKELTADLVGEYLFTDSDFINRLSTEHRNVFQKIYDEIKYLYKVATAGSKEARQLEAVKKAFDEAYRAGGKAQSDTKYSISSDSNGKQLTAEQQEYFKDSKVVDENGNLKVMYHGSSKTGFHVFDNRFSDDGTSFFFVDRNDVAATYSGSTEEYTARTFRTTKEMNQFFAEIGHDDYGVYRNGGKFALTYDDDTLVTKDTLGEIYDEFCDYAGVGFGAANYKVYLNLTNPLEVDAQGRNWNNVSREFSQEVADKYNALTDEQKQALTRLAAWEDISIFRSELRDAYRKAQSGDLDAETQALAIAFRDLGGDKANFHDMFTIASEGFSDEVIKQFAVKQMNTRDYAQKAKEQGHDGVIFKNIVDLGGYSNGSEGAATVAIAFDSNQIKSVANAKPTADADIRYSLSDADGTKISEPNSDGNVRFSLSESETDNRSYAEITAEQMRLRDRDYALQEKKREATNNPELLQAMDDYSNLFTEMKSLLPKKKQGTATQAELERIEEIKRLKDVYIQRVADIQEKIGLNAISREEAEIRETREALRVAADAAWAREGAEKENRAIEKSGLSAPEYFRKKAIKAFKTTTNFNEAGYMLPDGKLLNFSGGERNHRYRDHREIGEIYEATNGVAALNRFLSDGNIRIMAESPGVDIASIVEPTKEQYVALRKFITTNGVKDGQFYIDFSDADGRRVGNYAYNGRIIADRIINDIKYFYQTGTVRESSGLTDFLSLSKPGETPKSAGNYNIYGKDIALAPVNSEVTPNNAEVTTNAPVQEDLQATELFPDDLAPAQSELESLRTRLTAIEDTIDGLWADGETEEALAEYERLKAEYNEVHKRVKEIEADEADRFASIEDADAPPEVENTYDEWADTIQLPKKAVTDIAKSVREELGLTNKQMADVHNLIREYAESEFPSREGLVEAVRERFGEYTETEVNEELAEVKRHLRSVRINVSDTIRGDIADYADFARRNFGKIRFSKEGRGVDSVYDELSAPDGYPGWFPANIDNATDQLLKIEEVANLSSVIEKTADIDNETIEEVADTIISGVNQYKQNQREKDSGRYTKENLKSLMESDVYAEDIAPVKETAQKVKPVAKKVEKTTESAANKPIQTVAERLTAKLQSAETELANNQRMREESLADFDSEIERLQAEYDGRKNKNTIAANDLLRRIERVQRIKRNVDADYAKRISDLEKTVGKAKEELRTGESAREQGAMREELHRGIVDNLKSKFAEKGFDFDAVLKKAKNLSTFATVDNTPQRVMEKSLGYKEGQILSDITVNKVAQNESAGIKWLNSFTNRKDGILAQISKQYNIKPGSKESAAAQMYAEGFYEDKNGDKVAYGDAELAKDFPNARTQANIKGLAGDQRIRQIYDETLAMINESRTRNAYPEIKKLNNYFLHFRAMDDAFSKLGIPFNPNDIKAKDLPTDLNGVTADLKPGQPYFSSALHREGWRTSFDLLGGLERYLTSAKNQIYHIDDIQTLRALRNYIADTYGQAHGLESLDTLSEEEAEERIKQVYGSHLSTFAKFLNEEANVIAGKTALIDRGLEGIIGRRGITFLNTVRKQTGSNMVGYNISSSLTSFLPVAQTLAKTNKADFVKAFAQTASNKVSSIFGKSDGFVENNPTIIRRNGADRFYRTPWEKMADPGYALMGAVDNISTELITRTKYNEYIRKGMDSEKAVIEADKWTSRLMADRSLGQQPLLYNSKMLGLVTQFQIEVRNQLDSQFYDTIQETKASNEDIQNGLARNAKTAAKVASTFVQLAVVQHLFGKAFESVAGYNPAFDIIDVLIKTFGFDDEEDSEDTVLDNIEEGFMALLEDLPYTSILTDGGRIPISSALPVQQFIQGEDKYGNEKSRWETLGEIAPYYVMPAGYGQVKKSVQGLKMFDDDLPISGSYTDSGNLRFPVEDAPIKKIQAGIFGQWASENARKYFNGEHRTLNPEQTAIFAELNIPIEEYWDYQSERNAFYDLKDEVDAVAEAAGATDEDIVKSKYLGAISSELYNLYEEQKEIASGNTLLKQDRLRDIQRRMVKLIDDSKNADNIYLDGYYAEVGNRRFDYNPEEGEWYEIKPYKADGTDNYFYQKEQEVTKGLGISYSEYWNNREEYDYAYDNPGKYAVAQAIGGYDSWMEHYGYLEDWKSENYIGADKDEKGENISGSRKKKVQDYINGLDLDEGEKMILYRTQYSSKADKRAYDRKIVEYLNTRSDIPYQDKVSILAELGFNIDSNGYITW